MGLRTQGGRELVGSRAGDGLSAFIVMPFAPHFDDVYDVIRQSVEALDEGLVPLRLDEVRAAGRITDDLLVELSEAALCIADVTDANPNVMWEVGFAAALRKPTVAISQSMSSLPFDIRDVRVLPYSREALATSLRAPLTESLRQTLKKYRTTSSRIPRRKEREGQYVIAVTGSSESIPDKAERRLAKALSAYIGQGHKWLVGSSGVVDELTVRLLADAGEEDVTVVGYTSFDVSGPMLSMLDESSDVDFLDASAEQMPLVPGAPSERDVLLAARADLVIVAWNGVSGFSRQLIDWLAVNEKDHLLVFIPPIYREAVPPLLRP